MFSALSTRLEKFLLKIPLSMFSREENNVRRPPNGTELEVSHKVWRNSSESCAHSVEMARNSFEQSHLTDLDSSCNGTNMFWWLLRESFDEIEKKLAMKKVVLKGKCWVGFWMVIWSGTLRNRKSWKKFQAKTLKRLPSFPSRFLTFSQFVIKFLESSLKNQLISQPR